MDLLKQLIALDQSSSSRLAIPREAHIPRVFTLTIAHSGDSPFWLAFAAALLIWGRDELCQSLGCRILAATLVAGTIVTALKWVFRRTRPPGDNVAFYSAFDRPAVPSGHAGRTACVATLVAPLLSPWLALLMIIWVGLVGAARVALQIHFASDVLAGWVAGHVVGLMLSPLL